MDEKLLLQQMQGVEKLSWFKPPPLGLENGRAKGLPL
jgi:hypothetical protein